MAMNGTGSITTISTLVLAGSVAAGEPLTLWYDRPATNWEKEALPLGNGRLGCMVFGGADKERIQFNEDTLWVGSEQDTGAYQAFGDIYVEMPHTKATDYRRELDISRAVHTVTYQAGDTNYKRVYFSSAPAQVMVFRYVADKKGAYTGRISLRDAHQAEIVSEGKRITARGNLGGYKGLKARGGLEVGITWTGGELVAATVTSGGHADCVVRYREKTRHLKMKPASGQTVTF